MSDQPIKADEDLLERSAPCQDCGKSGTYAIDPYREEITGQRIVIPLCDSCYREYVMEI